MFKQPPSQPPLAGTTLCCANNQLMSSSAHVYPVISRHNNPAASQMWQEAEAPTKKTLSAFKEREVKLLFRERQALQALMPYYCPHTRKQKQPLCKVNVQSSIEEMREIIAVCCLFIFNSKSFLNGGIILEILLRKL